MSLLNSNYFGNITLLAYFGFCCITAITILFIIFEKVLQTKSSKAYNVFENNGALNVFLLFIAYILGHSLLSNGFGFSHYYWLMAGILLLISKQLSYHRTKLITVNRFTIINSSTVFLHRGIEIIAFIESAVVILQLSGLCPSMNQLFPCTGTWVNPNVTAMFLALSLWSHNPQINNHYSKVLAICQLSFILLAICFLRCRTAYIVTLMMLLETYGFLLPFKKTVTAKLIFLFSTVIIFAYAFKTNSTEGRIQIWKNCLQLAAERPITGVGFGQFEKEYNMFVALHNLPSKDHVKMPYNDFLELAVEGGMIAMLLWMIFLILLIKQAKKDSNKLSLIVSFILIQLTNFGFQAIPVFALFLVYAGTMFQSQQAKYNSGSSTTRLVFRSFLIISLFGGILICVRISSVASAFHTTASLVRDRHNPTETISEYGRYSSILEFSANYHEKYGDLLMESRNYEAAKLQYKLALVTTSRPNVLGKCGWCYVQLKHYDSAFYYFNIIEKLQPYKYAPRMALLKLYEKKNDTLSIKLKAREIMKLPISINDKEAEKIKLEANKWLR